MIDPLITSSSYLIEDCFKLRLGDLGKFLLIPVRIEESDDLSKQTKTGRSGAALLLNGLSSMRVDYKMNLNREPNIINIRFSDGRKESSSIDQAIEIEKQELLFGTRFFFKCRCGKRLNVLYLRPDMPYCFACRECLNLKYFLTTINRKVLGRELFYWFDRSRRVKEKLAEIKQLTKNGKITRKAAYALHYASKYNLANNSAAKATIEYQMNKLGVKMTQNI